MPARLPDEPANAAGGAPYRLPIRHARLTHIPLNLELALHPVNQYLQVKLAHAGHDSLPGFVVIVNLECGIFVRQLHQRIRQLILVGARARLNRNRYDRFGETDGFKHDGVGLVADGVARRRELQAHRRRNLAGMHLFDVFAVLCVHLHDAPQPLAPPVAGIVHRRPRRRSAGIHPKIHQPPDIRIRHSLERQRRKRLFRVRRALNLFVGSRGCACYGGNIEGGGEELADGVYQRLDALGSQRSAAEHRHNPIADCRPSQRILNLLVAYLFVFEIFQQQIIVSLGYLLYHLCAIVQIILDKLFRHRTLSRDVHALFRPSPRLALDKVDDAQILILLPDGYLHRHRIGLQPMRYGVDGAIEVRPHPVHLVHKADARHIVLIRLPPHRLGLRLHARHRIEHHHAAVKNTQTALHLGGEVHMPRRVYNVDGIVAPFRRRRRRCDGDAALAFLRHPIHRRRPVVHAANLADAPREIQHALRNRRLAGVNMGDKPNVSCLFQTLQSCRHLISFLRLAHSKTPNADASWRLANAKSLLLPIIGKANCAKAPSVSPGPKASLFEWMMIYVAEPASASGDCRRAVALKIRFTAHARMPMRIYRACMALHGNGFAWVHGIDIRSTTCNVRRRGLPPPFCAPLRAAALPAPDCAPPPAAAPQGFRASAGCPDS